jgi:Flp pilus assembly protein TadD
MGVTRILDLIVLILLATILLMPRPDASVKPALNVDGERRERVAELQSILIGHPDDAAASIELANIYLDGHRPDWALAAATSAARFHGNDYRLHHLRAIAYADRFEGEPAFEAAEQALSLCDQAAQPPGVPACDDAVRGRISLLQTTLQASAHVDMKNAPYLAKEKIFHALHPTFVPKPKSGAAKKPAAAPHP